MSNHSKKTRHISEDEKVIIQKTFDALDTDSDGLLNYHETKAAVRALGFDPKKLQIVNIIKSCEKHGDKIDYESFYYIMADKIVKRNPTEEIKCAFKLLCEMVNCETIGLVELKKINIKLGTELSNDEMRAMIEEFDVDGDKRINEDEFLSIMEPLVDELK